MEAASDPALGGDGVELVERPHVGRIFDARRRVRLGDSSPRGRLRLDACARYLQDIANDDSRDAGTPNPTAWVARRTVMRVERFPVYLDMLELSTWCSGLGPRWAERRYSVVADPTDGTDAPGRIEATTLWVHVDMATMRPIPVPEGFDETFGAAAGGRTVRARQTLPTRPPEGHTAATWPVRVTDFDVLAHVNNAIYWAMLEEALATRRDLRAPITIVLEHHAGIEPDEPVDLSTTERADGIDLWVHAAGRLTAVARARIRSSAS